MLRRNLILGERIMYVNGQTPVNCVFTATVRGHIDAEMLHLSLARLQSRHPLLQACIHEHADGRPYFISDGSVPCIPVRMIERLTDDDWAGVCETEWATPFDLKGGPLARLVWLRSASFSDLMIVCPHCICDGVTILTLMRELLSFLDHPHQDMPSSDSFASVEELIPERGKASKGNLFRTAMLSFITKLVFSLKPSRKPAAAGKPYLVHWKLNGKASAMLIERCRNEKVTVFSALCVAFLSAFCRVRPGARNQLICPVNIRKLVPEIRDDMMFAFAPIIKLSVAEDAASPGFWEKARQLKDDAALKVAGINGYDQLQASEHYHSSVKKLLQYMMTEEGSHDFTFSNMGRLDMREDYRSFTLENIYSANVAFPWKNPTTIVVSTFQGKMDFCFMSNTGSIPYEDAMTIKGKALAMILEELTVSKVF